MSRGSITLAILAMTCATGCVSEVEKGDITVSWTIGLDEPTADQCSAAGVDAILIILDSQDHDEMEDSTCTAGERTFRGLPVANYTVRVQGLDDSECAVYAGSLANIVPSSGVEPEQAEIIMQRITPGGSLSISWRFEDGMMCGAHGVEEVHIQILSDDTMVIEDDMACDEGMVIATDVPAGSIDLRISAMEGAAELCYVETNIMLEPCDELTVDAELAPCL